MEFQFWIFILDVGNATINLNGTRVDGKISNAILDHYVANISGGGNRNISNKQIK